MYTDTSSPQPHEAVILPTSRMASAALVATMLEKARPKEIKYAAEFTKVLEPWQVRRRLPFKRGDDGKEFQEMESKVLEYFPLKHDQVVPLKYICEELGYQYPPLCFGWIVTVEEIVNLALDKGAIVMGEEEEYFEPGDPDIPEEAIFDMGQYVLTTRTLSPSESGNRLLQMAKEAVGIESPGTDLEPARRCNYFTIDYVVHGLDNLDPRYEKIMFACIYTTDDLIRARGRRLLPSAEEVRKVQEWLGFSEREPGWWFSHAGLALELMAESQRRQYSGVSFS